MQHVRATSTAAVFLLLGAIVPAYAQRDQQGDRQGKAEKQQGRQQRAAPQAARQQRTQAQPRQQQRQSAQQPQQQRVQQTQQQQRPQQQQRVQQTQQQRPQQQQRQSSQRAYQQRQPQRTRQQAVAWEKQRGWLRQGGWQGGTTWQQAGARRWENQHRNWAQRGGYGGYYIPQDRFSLYFGRRHWFRMHSRPVMYMGYPRFAYGGYSFLLLDPWPGYWGEDWYQADDVYVDYDDGYYLYNRRYPSVRLAISVVL